MIRKYH